eukprot:TRINITY_DN2502_c0_g1_i4.p1 TRINITY_DN2502_c0_g1~~TRINITY_DN2502_c0_g1_i4.p1  ORF type:complete len:316 (-),score=98.85 TRINITY_DN2502_c0_g1_i4:1534-2451(-)
MSDEESDPREAMLKRHRTEKKDLQAQIQALKKSVPKGDKKKKKEITENIAQLEEDLNARHKKELEEMQSNGIEENRVEELTNGVAEDLKLDDGGDEEDDDAKPLGPMPIKQESQNKTSKAQKRRDKKAAKERERQQEIEKAEEENKTGPRAKEHEAILAKLKSKNYRLKEIPSDGDCLFASIADQLKNLSLELSVAQLRDKTATELEAKSEEYLPFLSNPNTGDMLTEDEYKDYCHKMRSTPVWGGQLELKALSVVLSRPIQVIQGEGPDIVIGEEFSSAGQPLLLTYHRHLHSLGEHYNSVSPV